MKKIIAVAMMGLLSSCSSEKTTEQKLVEVDQLFSAYDSLEMPGAAVMIIQDGVAILQKGYGIADFEQNIAVTSKTNFRLASVTKQFTAMSILQLIERGELYLDTSLVDIFPGFPEYGNEITIEHLLQHTSGLFDYEGMVPKEQTRQVNDKDVLEMMMGINESYFAVGEKHQYSNTAYALLTQILEKITGMAFRDYLKENIFDPLEMNNTLAHEKGINQVSNRAYGHTIEETGVKRTDQSLFSAVLGDGGIYSNLEDLYKWDQSLYTDQILGAEYLEMAFTDHKTNDGKVMSYGYGWRLENYKGMDIIYHTGSSIGFRNILYRIPSKNFTAVILTNRDEGGEFSTHVKVHEVVDIFFNQ
ncbi:MAG: beta-lactamase family protein [Emcibacteraceae bacterium]|nr:beta-lactamase family protein [Emcibacteraceae bacterium]